LSREHAVTHSETKNKATAVPLYLMAMLTPKAFCAPTLAS